MRIVDLSHTIISGMAQWPGDEQPLLIHRRSMHGQQTHMSSSLEFGCHIGTHIDAPLHFKAEEAGIDALPLERFIGQARLIRLPADTKEGPLGPEILAGHELAGVDFVLLATGWARHWGTREYYRAWPFLSAELALDLAGRGLKGVGLDTPSLDGFSGRAAHDICAAVGMINIENLAGLDNLPVEAFTLHVLPLKLEGTEASPVRAIALWEEI